MKNLTEKIKGLIQKFCTKEVILYAVFGVLTTIINWGTFAILTKAFSNLDKKCCKCNCYYCSSSCCLYYQ